MEDLHSPKKDKDEIIISTFHKLTQRQRAMRLIVALVVVLVAAVAVALLVDSKSDDKKPTTSTSTATVANLPEAKVSVTSSGFVPETLVIKKGQSVTWTNTDTAAHQIATDPFPQEDGLEGFVSQGPSLANDTFTFTFDTTGTFTYHDHLNPEKFHGTVVVE